MAVWRCATNENIFTTRAVTLRTKEDKQVKRAYGKVCLIVVQSKNEENLFLCDTVTVTTKKQQKLKK